jgi:hypothetical protein
MHSYYSRKKSHFGSYADTSGVLTSSWRERFLFSHHTCYVVSSICDFLVPSFSIHHFVYFLMLLVTVQDGYAKHVFLYFSSGGALVYNGVAG